VNAGAVGLSPALMNPCYWPEVRRGSERFAHDLGVGLAARGHSPALITSHRAPPRTATEDGMTVVRTWRPPDSLLERRGFEHHLTHVPLASRALVRGDYDVANPLYAADAGAALAWKRRTGRPVVYSFMGVPLRRYLVARRRRLRLVTEAVAGADRVVALSRAAASAFERELGIEPLVINPGVDLGAFSPGGERAPQPTVLCPGDPAAPHKRIPVLLEAARLARARVPDLRVVLSRPRDRQLASEFAGVGSWVELRDFDDHADLLAGYREAWVTALASSGEAFGLVLTESLACGTPVVTTSDGAGAEILDGEDVGVLAADGSPDGLAVALLDGLELVGRTGNADACRSRAGEFSVERCVEAYERLYRELCGQAA
jgi:glycosyltransferase involved in cell wall biosynthesis